MSQAVVRSIGFVAGAVVSTTIFFYLRWRQAKQQEKDQRIEKWRERAKKKEAEK